jgi:hypothetical protein
MISLLVAFYMFLFVFAIIGSMRGWAKELLVIFSVILALAFIALVENLIPVVGSFIKSNPTVQFWFRITTVMVMTFFGYQTPKLARFAKAAERRDQIQDVMLGFIMGAISGYFVVGTLWSFVDSAGYPYGVGKWLYPPTADQYLGNATLTLIKYLPPVWLGKSPIIYIAVVLAFVFVIIVFI